ncbi:hypothetical protein TWF696_005556 [Orbilia brochopaga]|uniref:Uncharacterized protein n=1 Tax=Orbilia brochopaga TaxID=3140254 RepID=A0AAV9V4Z6_9PEZI
MLESTCPKWRSWFRWLKSKKSTTKASNARNEPTSKRLEDLSYSSIADAPARVTAAGSSNPDPAARASTDTLKSSEAVAIFVCAKCNGVMEPSKAQLRQLDRQRILITRQREKAERRHQRLLDEFEQRLEPFLQINDIGWMLARLEHLGSVEALEQRILDGPEFPEFAKVWREKNVDLSLLKAIERAMGLAIVAMKRDASEAGIQVDAYAEDEYLGLSIWVLTSPDSPPTLPPALDGLPWFRTAVEGFSDDGNTLD